MLTNYKKPRDEGKIACNRKAHMEKGVGKEGNKGGGNSRKKWTKDGGGGGSGGNQNNDNSNYGNGGVQMMVNKWM